MPLSRILLRRSTIGLALLAVSTCLAVPAGGEQSNMRLRLKDGSFATGRVVPSDQPDTLAWLSDGFLDPFMFELGSIRAINTIDPSQESGSDEATAPANPPAGTRQFFELAGGGMIAGKLLAVNADTLTLESSVLGVLQVPRAIVVSMVDANYTGKLITAGPREDEHWRQAGEEQWLYEAGAWVAQRQGVALAGDVQLPEQAQLTFALSWKGSPDFVFSFGTDASAAPTAMEEVTAAARIEVWDKQLALLREVDDSADIELLAELSSSNPRLELTVYLDQTAGTVIVFDSQGRLLDEMTLPPKKPSLGTSVQLVNHGPALTLERLEVRAWDGLTTAGRAGSGVVLADGNQPIAGAIVGFRAESQELLLELPDGQTQAIPIADIRRGDFLSAAQLPAATSANTDNRAPEPPQALLFAPLDGEAQLIPAPEQADAPDVAEVPTQLELVWSDRSRLKGEWLESADGRLRFQAESIAEPLAFAPEDLIGIVGSQGRYPIDLSQHKNGTLKVDDTQLFGYLEETSPAASTTVLWWHPHGSRTASRVSESASGAIIYRKPLPKVTSQESTTSQRDLIVGPMVQMFLGGPRPGQAVAADSVPADNTRPDTVAREIVFRSGDTIHGVVQSIDDEGVRFSSAETQTTFARHDQLQSVNIAALERELEIAPEKFSRLLTVPRSMKKDPPTHLLVSVSGDYLRGRLVSLDAQTATVEIRLEVLEIPRNQIARIVWLHDRDWKMPNEAVTAASEKTPPVEATDAPFRVHAIQSSDRGLTFVPQRLQDGVLSGHSELLGQCTVQLGELNQVLFGKDISEQIRQFMQDPWTLSLAQSPRVFAEDATADPLGAGLNSPLVGVAAPKFGLKTLTGDTFRLEQQDDRVIVLDFWASWCGPCMQTMPLVEEVVAEVGGQRVQLVAVNIQETPSRIQAAVERLGLTATVLLDRDGEVAAAYAANAIPQTVIIDSQGIVTHVFVGGGSRFVDQFRQALTSVVSPPTSSL